MEDILRDIRASGALEGQDGLVTESGEIDWAKMGPEAQEMWKMLDQLSTSSPEAYQRLLKQQFEEMQASTSGKHLITPSEQCCYQVTIESRRGRAATASSGDAAPPDAVSLPAEASPGQTLYLNICCHDRVAPPTLPDGTVVAEPRKAAASLTDAFKSATSGAAPRFKFAPRSVPLSSLCNMHVNLALSPVRPVRGTARREWALDVIVHPWLGVALDCRDDFTPHFAPFAVATVAEALRVTLSPPTTLKARYMDGVKSGSSTQPQPFDMTPYMAPAAKAGAPAPYMMTSTSALLSALHAEKPAPPVAAAAAPTPAAAPRGPLIAELDAPPLPAWATATVNVAMGVATVVVRVHAPLTGVTMAQLELDVTESSVQLAPREGTFPATWSAAALNVTLPQRISVDAAKASFNRAAATVTVTAPVQPVTL